MQTSSSIRLAALGCCLIVAGGGCHPYGGAGAGSRPTRCGTCGGVLDDGQSPPPPAALGYDNHPRFHPVPVRPVFSPYLGPEPVPTPPPDTGNASVSPPGAIGPSLPKPEEIPVPPPKSVAGPNLSVPNVPNTLPPAQQQASDWIFSPPPPPGKPEPAVTIKTDPTAAQQNRR